MIFLARSEIERSMMSATPMIEAARRNQIGQPAACRIANNRFPYRFFDRARGMYGKAKRRSNLVRRSKRGPSVVPALHAVVDSAISTKTCGKLCGLSMNRPSAPRHQRPKDGRDEKLSSALRFQNMWLRKRMGLRAL